MRVFGLIGNPLKQSDSKVIFERKFKEEKIDDARFELFPIPFVEKITNLLQDYPELKGLAVTIPYKQQIIPFLTEISDEARSIGAVNCISISDKKLSGFNTDVFGFEQSLLSFIPSVNIRALVLGTGGASKAVQYILNKHAIPFKLVSRNSPDKSTITYKDLTEEMISSHKLIINSTPLGMTPSIETFPDIPYQFLSKEHFLYDLVYKPGETMFLQKGKEIGARIKNGYEMLELQAEKNWEIWNKNQ